VRDWTSLKKARITSCCSPEDMADAEKSARGMGIPFYALKMEGDFRENVIDPFHRRLPKRPDAQPVRALQYLHQVR
jgi:tRNA U34 2-thiouridine synthase MnmA/TrmU